MSPMCVLTDDMLPLDAASIKRKQARPWPCLLVSFCRHNCVSAFR